MENDIIIPADSTQIIKTEKRGNTVGVLVRRNGFSGAATFTAEDEADAFWEAFSKARDKAIAKETAAS